MLSRDMKGRNIMQHLESPVAITVTEVDQIIMIHWTQWCFRGPWVHVSKRFCTVISDFMQLTLPYVPIPAQQIATYHYDTSMNKRKQDCSSKYKKIICPCYPSCWWNTLRGWILMLRWWFYSVNMYLKGSLCLSTRVSLATMLSMHPCVFSCWWVYIPGNQ